MWTLVAVLLPALGLPCLLAVASGPGLPRLTAPAQWPPELWSIAITGGAATLAGVLDWWFHRMGGRRVPCAERRMELCALALGAVLFALLVVASVSERRGWLLAPIVAAALATAALVRLDERRFHRACGRYETWLHRLLVGGNGLAFLAWVHWCFARGALHG